MGRGQLSQNGVWRILRRHGLNTRTKRLGLVAGYAAPPGPARPKDEEPRHLEADHPGQLVQMDCFWKPSFARYLVPKYTGLRRDLTAYLRYYNQERAHTGRWNRGRTPEQVLGKAKIWAR